MGYLVPVKQGGHVPRSTRNVPEARGGPGLEPQRWCWRGGVWLPRVTGRCRCPGVQVRSVWRVHQLQALPQNNEFTVEGAARVAWSWFMFGAVLVQQNNLRVSVEPVLQGTAELPSRGRDQNGHPHQPGWGRAEGNGTWGASRARDDRSSTGGDPGAVLALTLQLPQSE